jgi:anti-sigma-K factor RskA
MRERLIGSTGDIARVEVGAGNVKDVQPRGDIVWSDSKQAGFIRISGLPKNDPNRETYQLWIIDSAQDPKTPIDGGVFDISADGEVIIPIDAKIAARDPKAFAITVERPGGVVVSKQERVVALAKRAT